MRDLCSRFFCAFLGTIRPIFQFFGRANRGVTLMKKSHLLLGATAFVVAISVSQPAFAQDAATAEAAQADEATSSADMQQAIVVTGSRIRRDEFSVAEPITVITAEEITQAGFNRSEEHTSELQSLMRISYAVFCLKKKKKNH